MSKPKFTPDGWHVEGRSVCIGDTVYVPALWCKDKTDEECRANANLIAAAPEMYKELERLSSLFRKNAIYLSEREKIEKILRKARGESSVACCTGFERTKDENEVPMTDETKKLFDAPWEVCLEKRGSFYRPCVVSSDTKIASVCTKENANRFSRLPELYDALMETVYLKCFECMGGLRHNIDLTREEIVKNGCPKQNKSNVCIYVKHIELIRKERDGK